MMAQQQGQQGGEQGRRRERNGQGQRVVGKSDEWEDWEDWLRGLPNSIYGRLVEHGPPMKTVPEAIRLRHSTRTGAETMTIMSPSTQPLRISPHISPPALYQDAVSDYYRRIGGD
ncbi:MAG TPA: hypothetical protein EYP10_12650 [Armatimonadetes bacterium]|nr:hypothetical protein [Armatimonadota bacterium]